MTQAEKDRVADIMRCGMSYLIAHPNLTAFFAKRAGTGEVVPIDKGAEELVKAMTVQVAGEPSDDASVPLDNAVLKTFLVQATGIRTNAIETQAAGSGDAIIMIPSAVPEWLYKPA